MRIIILSLTILISSSAMAQFENSKWLFSASLEDPIDLSEFRVHPGIAYAMKDNAMIGLDFRFNDNTREYLNNGTTLEQENLSHNFSFSPYYEHYFPLYSKWFFSLRVHASLGFSNSTTISYDSLGVFVSERNYKARNIGIGINPSVSYKVKDWMMIRGSLGGVWYGRNRNKNAFKDGNASSSNSNVNWSNASSLNSSFDLSNLTVIFILPNKD